jgi:hypothetical protein
MPGRMVFYRFKSICLHNWSSSTVTFLIKMTDSWRKAIDNGEKVVSVFLDLIKAFDVIDHTAWLCKVSKAGFRQTELNWFISYLSGRNQRVTFNDVSSERMNLSHGVPHGCVLGPTLFNIHINGITSSCAGNDCSFTLYVDGTEIQKFRIQVLTLLNKWWSPTFVIFIFGYKKMA